MAENPESNNARLLTRAGIAGAVLGGGLVTLFFVIWIVLGELDVADLPRLVAAVCVPPGLIAGGIAVYLATDRSTDSPTSE